MEELDDAISKLYVSRITAKFFARMCDAIKTQVIYYPSHLIRLTNLRLILPGWLDAGVLSLGQ
jgi:hypothetical protein